MNRRSFLGVLAAFPAAAWAARLLPAAAGPRGMRFYLIPKERLTLSNPDHTDAFGFAPKYLCRVVDRGRITATDEMRGALWSQMDAEDFGLVGFRKITEAQHQYLAGRPDVDYLGTDLCEDAPHSLFWHRDAIAERMHTYPGDCQRDVIRRIAGAIYLEQAICGEHRVRREPGRPKRTDPHQLARAQLRIGTPVTLSCQMTAEAIADGHRLRFCGREIGVA